MRESLFRTCVLSVGMCLMAVVASAQKVSVDYDKEVNLASFSSYAWEPGVPAPSPLVDKRIIAAIDRQLASKGWAKDDSAPSAIITYQAGVEVERQLNSWGSGPRWSGFGTVNVEQIHTGLLLVDIYEAKTGRLIWRGFASDTISDDIEKNEKRMNEAVSKMFKQLPAARTEHSGTKQD